MQFLLLPKATQDPYSLGACLTPGPDVHRGITDHQALLREYIQRFRGVQDRIWVGLGVPGGLSCYDDMEEGCQFELVEEGSCALLITGRDNRQWVILVELLQHFPDPRDEQEMLHRSRPVTVDPFHDRGNFIVQAEGIREADQEVAGGFRPHHKTMGCQVHILTGQEKANGLQHPFDLLGEHVICVAQGPVHIEAQQTDPLDIQEHHVPPSKVLAAIVPRFQVAQHLLVIIRMMATWIVHLRLAENLLEHIPDLDAAAFAVGNIAPDSGIPDEKWEHFTPPPHVTHFKNPGPQFDGLADLEFYRRYMLPLGKNPGKNSFSFRLGYFFHLVTDNLWNEMIGNPTRERFTGQFQADKNFIWEVKRDWYGLDHIYIRDHPGSHIWQVFLAAEPTNDGLDFLPLEGVCRNFEYIKTFYQRRDEKIQEYYLRPYQYLSKDEMDRFVEEVSGRLERIYNGVWRYSMDTDGRASALEMVA